MVCTLCYAYFASLLAHGFKFAWQHSAYPEAYHGMFILLQAICENSKQPLVVQLVDSGTSNISIRAQDFTALAPAYLGSIPVSVQQVCSRQCC